MWVEVIAYKTCKTILNSILSIFLWNQPNWLQIDDGTGLYNKLFKIKKHKIKYILDILC